MNSNFSQKSSEFGGSVVRSRTISKRRSRTFYQWFDEFGPSHGHGEVLGDELLDEFEFEGADSMGPAVIYRRVLGVETSSAALEYFAGNRAVDADRARRQGLQNNTRAKQITDAQRIAGFHEIYASWIRDGLFDFESSVWDQKARLNYEWLGCRCIGVLDTKFLELVSFVGAPPLEPDGSILERVSGDLAAQGVELLQSELFSTHALRPESGQIIFEVNDQAR